MSWLICGTVPDDAFPLCLGTWRVDGSWLRPVQVESCNSLNCIIPSVPLQRGTPALVGAATLASRALGGEVPQVLLAGDCGSSHGSMALYAFLEKWLAAAPAALNGLTFHYLFPSVDGHNRILMTLEERASLPVLIADAGFMYAAKMSGYASRYDVFTPDAGELAFLADEKAPHPFYTRGFLLSEGNSAREQARLAWAHGDSARLLLIKGRNDLIADQGEIIAEVNSPSLPFMEPVGGTGDLVTGLITAMAAYSVPLPEACICAARCARIVGELVQPTPASSIAEFMPFVEEGVRRCTDICGHSGDISG